LSSLLQADTIVNLEREREVVVVVVALVAEGDLKRKLGKPAKRDGNNEGNI
jgi:hypothetical protein